MKQLFAFLVFACLIVACHTAPPRPSSPKGGEWPVYVANPAPQAGSFMPDRIPVYVDERFTDPDRAEIHAALDEWNHVLNGYRVYFVDADDFAMQPSVLYRVLNTEQGLLILHTHPADVDGDPSFEGVLAWVPGLGAPIVHVIADRVGTRSMRAIVMHEIGHTLGLEHVLVKGTLMFPSYPFGLDCIDKVTVQALASTRASRWDWHHMNYCERPL